MRPFVLILALCWPGCEAREPRPTPNPDLHGKPAQYGGVGQLSIGGGY